MKRTSIKENKLETSKPMARMRQVAFGREMTQSLLKMELHQAERNDADVMSKAEAKRQRKAEKARKLNGAQ